MALINFPSRTSIKEKVLITRLTSGESLSVGDTPLNGLNNTYYAPTDVEIQLTCNIINKEEEVQTEIDQEVLGYPPVLKMPVVKFAGGINGTVVDEVYFTVTLVQGVLTATGTLPSSGDWKLLTGRINQSLESIGADWKVERSNTTFLA